MKFIFFSLCILNILGVASIFDKTSDFILSQTLSYLNNMILEYMSTTKRKYVHSSSSCHWILITQIFELSSIRYLSRCPPASSLPTAAIECIIARAQSLHHCGFPPSRSNDENPPPTATSEHLMTTTMINNHVSWSFSLDGHESLRSNDWEVGASIGQQERNLTGSVSWSASVSQHDKDYGEHET